MHVDVIHTIFVGSTSRQIHQRRFPFLVFLICCNEKMVILSIWIECYAKTPWILSKKPTFCETEDKINTAVAKFSKEREFIGSLTFSYCHSEAARDSDCTKTRMCPHQHREQLKIAIRVMEIMMVGG